MLQNGPLNLDPVDGERGVIRNDQFVFASFFCQNNSPYWVYFMPGAAGSGTGIVDTNRYSVVFPPYSVGSMPAAGNALAYLVSSHSVVDIGTTITQAAADERIIVTTYSEAILSPMAALPGLTQGTQIVTTYVPDGVMYADANGVITNESVFSYVSGLLSVQAIAIVKDDTGELMLEINNTHNAGNIGSSILELETQPSGGDPFARFIINGVVNASLGLDNTDNKFKLSFGTDPGSDVMLTVEDNGAFVFVPGTMTNGSIQISTPGGVPGVIFFDNTNGYRADIRRTATGVEIGTHANTTQPSAIITLVDSGTDIQIIDGGDFIFGSTNGTKIGTSATQKIGFFGATPIVRATAPTAAPAGGVGVAAGAWSSAANRDTAINCINGLRTALINLGLLT